MSILDGPFRDREHMQATLSMAGTAKARLLPLLELTEDQRRLLDVEAEGRSRADMLGITKEQRDALLNVGCRFLQTGELQKAREVLSGLYQLEPLDERPLYALGATYQMEGNLPLAAHFYIQFLGLNATNPEGYLRLGECLMAAGEIDEARSAFTSAKTFAESGKGRPGNAAEALRNLALLDGAVAPMA